MEKKANGLNSYFRTYGPVPDLERHLPCDWWKSLFNSMYLKTDGDVVENEHNTRAEVDLIEQTTGIEPNDRILDLCCGQGRHSLELARRGYRKITGLDRSRYLVRLARIRAKRENLNVVFSEGDARKFRLPRESCHAVLMLGNSFGYFEHEDDDRAVLRSVMQALRSRGVLVLDLVDGEWMRANFCPRSWEWIDQNQFVCRERSLAADGQRLISREIITHAEKGVIVDQFYAERLYEREHIRNMLAEEGFQSIRFQEGLSTESTRGQDLGMMENRLWITAKAPRKAIRTRAAQPLFPDVAVLLGDPNCPDRVKPEDGFTDDVVATVNCMKEALSELGAYRFTFLENHDTLFSELRSRRPQFVFNLCDEGFSNDPIMEAHIPAVMEMLDIPYSGAGPGCLTLCYNKSYISAIAASLEIPVALETYSNPDDLSVTLPSSFPAIIKPTCGDGSYGIYQQAVVHNEKEFIRYVRDLGEEFPAGSLLVQEFLDGPEYSVGIIGNVGLRFLSLPILEVDYDELDPSLPKILGYESKWLPDSPYWKQIKYREARLEQDDRSRLLDYASLLFERLGCRDYARFDFRADANGTIKLLEVNPNPGWCWDGKMNLMAAMAGFRYADFLRLVIEAAQERTDQTKNNKSQFDMTRCDTPHSSERSMTMD